MGADRKKSAISRRVMAAALCGMVVASEAVPVTAAANVKTEASSESEGQFKLRDITSVSMVCDRNSNHQPYTTDKCPVCEYQDNNKTSYNNVTQRLAVIETQLDKYQAELDGLKFPGEKDVLERDASNLRQYQQNFNENMEKYREYVRQYKEKEKSFKTQYETGSTVAFVSSALSEIYNLNNQALTQGEQIYNSVKLALQNAERLVQNKITANEYEASIKIQSNGGCVMQAVDTASTKWEGTYTGTTIMFRAEAPGASFESGYLLDTRWFLQDSNGNWNRIDTWNIVDAGTYKLRVETNDADYKRVYRDIEVTIKKKALQVKLTDTDKVYDGKTAGTFTAQLTGIVNSDDVRVGKMSGEYISKNVGKGVVIVPTGAYGGLELTGGDASNYVLEPFKSAQFTGDITPAPLKVSVRSGVIKTYGELPSDSEMPYVYDGFVGGDTERDIQGKVTLKRVIKRTDVGKQAVSVSVSNPAKDLNYTLTSEDGTVQFIAPSGYSKVNMQGLDISKTVVVDGVSKTLTADENGNIHVWHPTTREISITNSGMRYTVGRNGEVQMSLNIADGNITIGGDGMNAVRVSQNGKTWTDRYSGIVVSGTSSSYGLTVSGYTGDITLQNVRMGGINGSGITVQANSTANIQFKGENYIKGPVSMPSVFVEAGSDIALIGGENAALEAETGIGAGDAAASGGIKFTSGTVTTGRIGNGRSYGGSTVPNIVLDSARLSCSSFSNIKDTAGNSLGRIEIGTISGGWNAKATHLRVDDGALYVPARLTAKGTLEAYVKNSLIGQSGATIKVKSAGKVYTVPLDSAPGGLYKASLQGSDKEQNGAGSSGNSASSEAVVVNLSGSNARSRFKAALDNSHIMTVINSKVYLRSGTLKAKDGYLLSANGENWKQSISAGDDGKYTTYIVYIRKTDTDESWKVKMSNVYVDTVKPSIKTTKIATSTKALKAKKIKAKAVNVKVTASFGNSGRKELRYRIDTKGKKGTFKSVPGSGNIKVSIKSGKQQLIVQGIDRAGNIRTVRSGWFSRG